MEEWRAINRGREGGEKKAKSKLRSDTFYVDPVDVIWIVPDLHLMVKTKMYFSSVIICCWDNCVCVRARERLSVSRVCKCVMCIDGVVRGTW